ncbi:hypothetical protein GDO81_012241 [Engystomops pustulosus]|nr:hypothetical protein GDO81_012241 [Engystomops pustulosus]
MSNLLPTIIETSNVDFRTPDAKKEQISEMNETWLPCSVCQERVNLCSLISHKQCHKAKKILGCKPEDETANLHILTVQKENMIAQIESSSEYKYREYQKINASYETLKGKMLSMAPYTSKIHAPFETTCHVYGIDGNSGLVKSIVVCCDKNTSWQSCMEDSFIVLDNYGHRENTCLVGIFDGYHGNMAALTAAAEFPILLLDSISALDPSYKLNQEEESFVRSFDSVYKDDYKKTEHIFSTEKTKRGKDPDIEGIHMAHAKAFWRMERLLQLGRKESSRSRWSGCSAVTCLIDGSTIPDPQRSEDKEKTRLGVLHVANIGDIKAVLCKNGKSYRLTRDHSAANNQERTRVLESGGSISSNESSGLIEGFSRISRGLGFHGDSKLKDSVIPAPYTISVPIYNTSQFVILASSGLWEVLRTREVVGMAQNLLSSFLLSSHDINPSDTRTEEDTRCTLNESSEHLCAIHAISDDTRKWYNMAAAYVCREVIKAAIEAGSQQNITVGLILLPGCDKGPGTDKSSSSS